MADLAAGGSQERFNFGRVVGQTFSLIGRNFVLFLLLALIFVGLPQFGLLYAQSYMIANQGISGVWQVALIGALVTMVTAYILQGALTRAAADDLSGAGVKFGAALGDGLRYFFPLFIVAILVTLGIWIGLILLIIPGIILALRWSITAPIVVIERDGPTKSMGRSAELTEGHRWAIFGLFLLYFVLAYASQLIVGALFGAFGAATGSAPFGTLDTYGLIVMGISAGVAALISLISTTGTAALYFELRRVKEGVGVEQIASVFD
jgi:Membrane domain of glycerophosphoryl diester phosphodiesterase